MYSWLTDSHIWWIISKVIIVNLLLSFDNAVIIALAASEVPTQQRNIAVFLGVSIATAILVVLTPFAVYVLCYPYVRLIGGLLLMWIAVKLLLPENDGGEEISSSSTLFAALKTIALANLVRSIDNVMGVAAASDGHLLLLIIGLVASMPVLIYGSLATVALVDRFPLFMTLGAAFIGFLAGEMIVSDAVVEGWVEGHLHLPGWHTLVPILSAGLVVFYGKVGPHVMRPAATSITNKQNGSE